jgi:outer membrane protein assembly factor BamB
MADLAPLIIGCNGKVAGIEPTSGKVLWTTELNTGGLFSATARADVCVLVKGGIVFAGCSGHLFCIDSSNGRLLWHNPLKGFGHNDVTLALEGVSVQVVTKVEQAGGGTSPNG